MSALPPVAVARHAVWCCQGTVYLDLIDGRGRVFARETMDPAAARRLGTALQANARDAALHTGVRPAILPEAVRTPAA